MNKQEDFQNRALAQLLTQQGVAADFERRAGRRRMDVVAEVDGLRVVLEAETGFHRKAQAIKDADARLHQKLATVVFAVCYPDGVTEDNLAEATLIWTLRLKPGEPVSEWSKGSVAQLAQAVQQAPRSLSGADVAARLLSDGLDEVVQRMKTPVRRALAQALDLPATKPQGKERGDGYFVAAKRGMLVVATAMLFHHRVHDHLPVQRPDGYDGNWPPTSATVCAEQSASIDAFREAWRGILAVDYRPVFETGRTALSALSIDPDTSQAVSSLARTVARISERVHGLRHDLLGRIFHRVLDTARYDGSFYTSTAPRCCWPPWPCERETATGRTRTSRHPSASATPPAARVLCSWLPPSASAICETQPGAPIPRTKRLLACSWWKTYCTATTSI